MKKVDDIISDIVSSNFFRELNFIIEDNEYHKQETVYDHLLHTLDRAKGRKNVRIDEN